MDTNYTLPHIWLTADLHLGHKNILRHCPGRVKAMMEWAEEKGIQMPQDPAERVALMDQWIIDRWNAQVSKKDSVYILGDFSFHPAKENEKLLAKLHGHKYLLLGNHDANTDSLVHYFKYIKQIAELKLKGVQDLDGNTVCLEMCHYPMRSWNRMQHGTLHLHGHCHNRLSRENYTNGLLRADIGWDSDIAGYGLVSAEQVVNYFRQFTREGESFTEYHKRMQRMPRIAKWVLRLINNIKLNTSKRP